MEGGSAGLIPSQTLEEKRKAFVKRDVELAPAGNRKEQGTPTAYYIWLDLLSISMLCVY